MFNNPFYYSDMCVAIHAKESSTTKMLLNDLKLLAGLWESLGSKAQ